MTGETTPAAPEVGGVDDRLLSWERVRDIAGISRTTAWRMQKTGDFPKPVQISPGRVGWWESELTAWKGARSAGVGLAPRVPPAEPRLPGMPRRMPGRGAVARAENHPVSSPDVRLTGAPADVKAETVSSAVVKPRRGRRQVSPDQIDFGF